LKKVSLLMLTIDRFDVTKRTLELNLKNAGYGFDIELLVCDNGSQDKRIIDYISKITCLKYHRINSKNEGVACAFNQLYLRSTGEYIVLLGNDIEMPSNWLSEMIRYSDSIPDSGIIGISWGHSSVPPLSYKHDIFAHWVTKEKSRVFGTWLIRRAVIEKIGFFFDGYGVYSLEDTDYNERVNMSGFNSCYIPNMRSNHVVHDVGSNTEYRKMKDASMIVNSKIFDERFQKFLKNECLIEPLPEKREPL
jgi:GT2 family glycosyltransferase